MDRIEYREVQITGNFIYYNTTLKYTAIDKYRFFSRLILSREGKTGNRIQRVKQTSPLERGWKKNSDVFGRPPSDSL